jgi:hypothetical protein
MSIQEIQEKIQEAINYTFNQISIADLKSALRQESTDCIVFWLKICQLFGFYTIHVDEFVPIEESKLIDWIEGHLALPQ